jgi:hypothetical protein
MCTHDVFRRLPLLLTTLGALAVSPSVLAQPSGGPLRLSLDGQLFATRSLTFETELPADPALGTGPLKVKQDQSTTAFGPLLPGLGVGVGYGLSDRVLLGARLLLTTEKRRNGGASDTRTTTASLVPYAELTFAPDAALQPVVGAEVGYASITGRQGSVEQSASTWSFGALVGLRAFAARGFSIDPTLRLQYVAGGQEVTDSASGTAWDGTLRGIGFAATVTFSGWIGAHETAAPAVAPKLAPAPEAEAAAPPLRIERGEVRIAVPLDSSTVVSLSGFPFSHPARMEVTLLTPGSDDEFANCRDVRLVADGASFALAELKHRRAPGGFIGRVTLSGEIDPQVVAAIGRAQGEADVVACGKRWTLGEPQRRAVQEFGDAWSQAERGPTGDVHRTGVRTERGVVAAALPLSSEVTLQLAGDPTRDAERIAATVAWFGDPSMLDDCQQVGIVVAGERTAFDELQLHRARQGALSAVLLRGTLDARSVLRLGEARGRVSVAICGRSVDVPVEQRQRAYDFSEVFAAAARAAAARTEAEPSPIKGR